jgi:Asp-tRNA(Asn)/Glu-tRNA(Gln) amidotransferase A subunit family amidase
MEPREYSAARAAAEIAAGRLTAERYVASYLERIAVRDKDVLAWASFDPDLALKQARARDKETPRGPLHGVPVGFKDIVDTVELPTEYGSPIYKHHRPQWDASCVALTKKAGGILMGKTATTEFAYRNPAPTRNPLNLAHTPGGSSSGSAAAVADFMVPIAIGSQTGGSTIRPASYCGVVGYKPTFGVINRAGVKPVAEAVDTVGVIAQTVEDAALYTRAVSGIEVPDFRRKPPNYPRVGFCRQSCWTEGEASMHEKLELAATILAKKGARLNEFVLGTEFDCLYADQIVVNERELARSLAFEYENHREKLSTLILSSIEKGWSIPQERYEAALLNAMHCRTGITRALLGYDFLLTPAAPGEAPRSTAATGSAVFNRAWTMLGVPCLTVPAYTGPSGLPIGVQIVGTYGADRDTLMWAEWARQMLTE